MNWGVENPNPRQFPHCGPVVPRIGRGFLGLGIEITVPSDQDDAKLSVAHKSLKTPSNVSTAISGKFLSM